MKKPLNLPDFKNEDTVQEFLDTTDFSEYLEPSDLKSLSLVELVEQSKLKTKSVTIRLPEKWILKAKVVAAQMDMPYQTFMKQLIRRGYTWKQNNNIEAKLLGSGYDVFLIIL